jgi:hypothetical protein
MRVKLDPKAGGGATLHLLQLQTHMLLTKNFDVSRV